MKENHPADIYFTNRKVLRNGFAHRSSLASPFFGRFHKVYQMESPFATRFHQSSLSIQLSCHLGRHLRIVLDKSFVYF